MASDFLSLDFIYIPAPNFESSLRHYTKGLGGKLIWKVKAMGTVVAMVKLSTDGPPLLIAEHFKGKVPILIYRVKDFKQTLAKLKTQGFEGTKLEIPHGPCFSFKTPAGQRFAIYELERPFANKMFDGRIDD